MKRFLKVRLLPVLLLLTLLCQALPVIALEERTYILGTRYAENGVAYGSVTAEFSANFSADFSASHLYYDQLTNDTQRALYEEFYIATPASGEIILTLTDVPAFTIPQEGATPAFQQMLFDYTQPLVFPAYAAASLDNPLLFWAKGIGYTMSISAVGNTVSSITLICIPDSSGNYGQAEYEKAIADIEDLFLSLDLREAQTPYEQMKAFHDYLCETVTYVESANSHNITGPLLYGKSVCEGYAKAFTLFCRRLEIPCMTVTGIGYTGNGSEPHAWNAVRMENGKWYAVDVTWDDQSSAIYYDFFLTGGETLPESFQNITFNQSHQALGDFYGNGLVVFGTPVLNPAPYSPESHTHVYTSVVTKPTCTEKGYTTYTCHCGDSYVGNHTPATGHGWDNGVVTKEPTEETEGTKLYTCTACGDTKEETVPTLEHVHSYQAIITQPTCTAEGFTTYTCRCGDSYVSDETPATGHIYNAVVTKPTCTEKGFTTYTCHCGDFYVGNHTPATGHGWDNGVVTKEPTEETEGTKLYTCTACGDTKEETVPTLEHVHSYQAIVTQPTCTEDGYTTYTCRCGDSYVADKTPVTEHNYTEWTVETFPTCTGSGTLRRECLSCGLVDKIFSTPADHQYEAVITEPTCTEEGFTTYTCPDCGEFYVDVVLPATGHSYEAVVTAPTCTEDGYTTYTCHCGDSYVDDEVPATGHTWEDTGIIPPGCEGNGWTTYVCTLCGKTKTVQKEPVYDADGSGTVNQADAELLLSILVGNTETEVLYDFDFDGALTIYDCVLLMQQIG